MHLPTAVYINGSGSGWYIKKVNAKLEVKNKTRFAKIIYIISETAHKL